MTSRKQQARVAGVLYLLMAGCAVVSLNNVPSWFVVGGDAAGTARQIMASEFAYRVGVVCDLAGQIFFVWLVLVLYHLFKDVNQRLAMLMVALVLIQVPMAFANMLLGMAPLILLSDADYLRALDSTQLEALTTFFVNLRGYGTRAVMALWGLWLLPLGLLVVRCGFIPRIIGWVLVVGCFGYLAVSVISLLLPAWANRVTPLLSLGIGEILIILWLLIVGAREPSPPPAAP